MTLLAVPNVSEGRDQSTIEAIGKAFEAGGGRLLDVHSDPDHHRTVYSLAGRPGALARAVLNGAAETIARVDLSVHVGHHPRVGAIDVAPIVYLHEHDRGAASAEALVLADLLGERLGLPVFLYGALAGGRTRAELRRGGAAEFARRVAQRELVPDFGPERITASAGAVLVTARPPLVAFNVELAPPATLEQARAIAARIRETGAEGLAGVRAIGVWLSDLDVAQVSTNVEDHHATSLGELVAAIARHAPVSQAELVGLAPRAALATLPDDLPLRGFDPDRHVIENVLADMA